MVDIQDPTATGQPMVPLPDRWGHVAAALAPAAVYLAVRLLGVAVLGVLAARNGSTLLGELASWDGEWLLGIAQFGYDNVPAGLVDAHGVRSPDNARVFFPGYPSTVAAVALLTGRNYVAAGLAVSAVAGVAAAYGMARLGEIVPGGSRRAGLALVGLFAAMPMGIALSMTYTEALFCAFAVWALVAVLREQWLLAAACTAVAGVVRLTATALIAAATVAALAAIVARRDGIRPWLCLLLAPSGLLAYLGYVGARTGELGGYFRIQRAGWDNYVDGGVATIHYVGLVLGQGQQVWDLLTVLALVGALVLLVVAVRMRLPWPLLIYGAVGLATLWGSNGVMNSKLRYVTPLFVLLVPVALGLARRRTGTAVAMLAGAALCSAWVGAYALAIWPYAI